MVVERTKLLMMEDLSYQELLTLRRSYVAKGCKLHFDAAPLKIVKGSKQYMYDEVGNEYLDCINYISHVGHCHPHVVGAGQEQMAKLATCQGFLSHQLSLYAKKLTETLPDRLDCCYFVNSGSEANDLAMRLARIYTKKQDFVTFENAFHGILGKCVEVSPLHYRENNIEKEDFVHVVPLPDTYRGKHRDTAAACDLYVDEFRRVLAEAQAQGREISAFIHEPLLTLLGCIVPPPNYLKQVYQLVREAGGLVIADEVACGMGRTGDNFWAFQSQDCVPDIITCGKPLGNGHPMAVVITTKEISDSMGFFASGFGGNPVSCAIGLAVMDVIKNEKLLSSAKCVGRVLVEGFSQILPRHPMMGDVRGQGLLVGVEIVTDKEGRKPAKEAAELLCYKLRQHKIIINAGGPEKNVIVLTPPMCFTVDNARRLLATFDECLTEIESGTCPDQLHSLMGGPVVVKPTQLDISPPLAAPAAEERGVKRPRYEDMD